MEIKTARRSKLTALAPRSGAILMLAMLALGISISPPVHLEVLAAQSSTTPESPIPVHYTDVRESAKITFQQDSTQTDE